MHLTTFKLSGMKFRSVEQAFQYLKATEFGDEECASAITHEWKPFNCRKLGKRARNYDDYEWRKK